MDHAGEGAAPYWAAAFLAGWVAERHQWFRGRLLRAGYRDLDLIPTDELFDLALVELVELVREPTEPLARALARVTDGLRRSWSSRLDPRHAILSRPGNPRRPVGAPVWFDPGNAALWAQLAREQAEPV